MKKILLLIIGFYSFTIKANPIHDLLVNNPYESSFRKAYLLNPSVPKGILESIAFSQTRFTHLTDAEEPSCIGYPKAYSVMGLTEDGKSYFRNNLYTVSNLSGYSAEEIKTNPEKSILAYAKAIAQLQVQDNVYGNTISDYKNIFIKLSELPLTSDLQNDFALNAHLYQLYWFMSKGEFQDFYGFPDYSIDLQQIFGTNYQVLSSNNVSIGNTITSATGATYRSSGAGLAVASTDYPPALWNPTTCNFSSRSGVAITAVAIHFVQGSYAGCISWFKNCSASASAHYVIRSSDGQCTQMVLESNKAWHAASANPYTLGTEHEGYISTASWFTTAMYTSSADLTRDMCTSNSINPLRCYYGAGCSGSSSTCEQGSCVKIKGHQMYPAQTHNDPGPLWNWERFYKLINNTPVTTTITSTAGNFYDSGGSGSDYSNDERKLWLFQPSGATSISMNFTSFNLENAYDYLFIYDGNSTSAALIGKYTSTFSPGSINSTGSSLLFEFRSDCATTKPGWAATYTTNAVATSTSDGIVPTTSISTVGAWKTANFTASFTDADLGGSGLEKSFYQVIDFNGTEWRANYTHGFFSDNFDSAIHPEWTQKTGTWGVTGSALEQTDEVSTDASNTNIYAALTQTLSNRYLYNFKGKIGGSGTNRRAGFHFFIDRPDSSNRYNSYFVYFRLGTSVTTNTATVEIYKTVNNVFNLKVTQTCTIVPSAWYDYKVIFDRTTGKIDVYQDINKIATWTDTSPHTIGDYISFRSGNCIWSLDEIKVYRSRPTTSVTVSVGTGLANDLRYQNTTPLLFAGKVKSIVNDFAGNLSTIDYENINVDWTNPSNITSINDGKAADINFVALTDSLSANWSSSKDPNSAIANYWYSIGTAAGLTDVLNWTSNWGDTIATAHGLTLTLGTTYYFNVKSENGAGLQSAIISTNGQKVVNDVSVKEFKDSNAITIFPNPFNNTFSVSLNLTYDTNVNLSIFDAQGKEIINYQTKESAGVYNKTIDATSLNLSNGTYLIKIKLNDKELFKKMIKQ